MLEHYRADRGEGRGPEDGGAREGLLRHLRGYRAEPARPLEWGSLGGL